MELVYNSLSSSSQNIIDSLKKLQAIEANYLKGCLGAVLAPHNKHLEFYQ